MCEYVVERAAANLPQSTQAALFTVSGGRVLVLGVVGEVTSAIQNQANDTSVRVNPSVGSDVTLAGLGSIEDRAAGTLLGLDQAGSSSLVAAVAPFPRHPVVVPVGTIDLNCAASNTGQVKWLLIYRPLDPGAAVVAA